MLFTVTRTRRLLHCVSRLLQCRYIQKEHTQTVRLILLHLSDCLHVQCNVYTLELHRYLTVC